MQRIERMEGQPLISKEILQDCKSRKKNLRVAWRDYQKAYESVLHSQLIKSLKII
jgi:hypothetical protein